MTPVTVMATVVLSLAAVFVFWPLVRHRQPEAEDGRPPGPSPRGRLLEEIEEVELDASSGRIDPEEAAQRLDELSRELGALPR